MLIERTIESSQCGRPRWHKIRVISGGGGQFRVKVALVRKYGGPSKIKYQAQFLGGGEIFPVPIGLTWEHDIVLNPSPCLHNGNEADDWMGLDERNNWFKTQVRDSNRSQDIVNVNKLKKFKIKTMEEIAL
ncbi:uncharacterized protein TNCV_4308181 [Trichonephila clavipes]|nr:uncharacterized protein TNCV_4308181 [Trichonephila clavipes]